jgi:hypothetical protein
MGGAADARNVYTGGGLRGYDVTRRERRRRGMTRTANGLLLLGVMLVVSACASTPAATPALNVTGTWTGTWKFEDPTPGGGDITMVFEQQGDEVSASYDISGPAIKRTNRMYGSVYGNDIKLLMPATGMLTVNGDQITGVINGLSAPARVTLKRQ